MKKMAMILAAAFAFSVQAWATNWEIVSIEKKRIAKQQYQYLVYLKDPYDFQKTKTVLLDDSEFKEIRDYFSANMSEMIGYQFIPDANHVGKVKQISEM